MRHKIIVIAIIAIFFAISAKVYADEIVFIPDSAFKKALIFMLVDTNKDGEIQFSEAHTYKGNPGSNGEMNITSYASEPIYDFTGLKEFISIKNFICYGKVYQNDSIDFSGMKNLEKIFIRYSSVTFLNMENCKALKEIDCCDNLIDYINLSNCINLTSIACKANNLINIELNDKNKLMYIITTDNKIKTITLKNSTNISLLDIQDNQLTELNVRNGNNKNIKTFNITGNADLECITVDDPQWSKENWTNVDSGVKFSLDCSISVIDAEEDNIKIYPNPAHNNLYIEFNCETETEIIIYNIQGKEQISQSVHTGYNFVNLDISTLAKGMYYIKINNQIKKIIVE